MSSTKTIREALAGHDDLQDVDWDNPDEVADIVAGDGSDGEGVDYRQGDRDGSLSFTLTWGAWVLTDGYTRGEAHPTRAYYEIWYNTYTVYPNRAAAKAAYIAALNAKQAEGAVWEPDYCPIFDKVQATW